MVSQGEYRYGCSGWGSAGEVGSVGECSGRIEVWQAGFVKVLLGASWSELVRFGWAGSAWLLRYVVVWWTTT